MLVKSGIEGLDYLQGGIKAGSFCIVQAPSMVGREVLLQQLFYNGLKMDEGSIFVTTKNFADEIIDDLSQRSWYLTEYSDKYLFIDTYSMATDPSIKDADNIKYIPSAADFASLSNTLVTSMAEFHKRNIYQQRICFDTIDTLLMYVGPRSVYRFLSYLRGKIKLFKALGFFTIEPELHDERAIKTIIQLSDMLFSLKKNDIGTIDIWSPTSKITGEYNISEQGLEIIPR